LKEPVLTSDEVGEYGEDHRICEKPYSSRWCSVECVPREGLASKSFQEENLKNDRVKEGVEGALSLWFRVELVMKICVQYLTKMSRLESMYWMAKYNDMEGITRRLDEGVNPAADEERDWVRLMSDCFSGWTGDCVS
jgi:hypothetical protein